MAKRISVLLVCLVAAWISSSTAWAGKTEDSLRATVEKGLGGMKISKVSKTPVAGIYEIHAGGRIMYSTNDGRHLFIGNLIDLEKQVNLTRVAQQEITKKRLAQVDESSMLVIGPKNAKHTLTAFTDVDCGYCAKLHLEVPKLNEAGIRMRYLFYPRAGMGSESFNKAVAVWCSKDRAKAIGDAKARKPIDMKTCDNPVTDHLRLGQELGLNGTPMLVMEDGTIINGYQPASEIIKAYQAMSKQ
ncbi:MAG: DsbC family protein [Gammaproteobacteria bacterium]|nr:DsbC family protein [Gammaproteobacteria bacterium]